MDLIMRKLFPPLVEDMDIPPLVLIDMGRVYSCGFNSNGQLGIGNTAQQTRPQNIDLAQNKVSSK
jgi:alpha-tubulin suppressor-like RCC1 family protein